MALYSPSFANPGQCKDLFWLSTFEQPQIDSIDLKSESLLGRLFVTTDKSQRRQLIQEIHQNDVTMAKIWQRENPQWPRPITMAKRYIGERDWTTLGMMQMRVSYLTREQRESLKVEMSAEGLRSSLTGERFSQDVSGIFVISPRGEMYLQWMTPEGVHAFRHSSFFAGAPVLFAGYLQMSPSGQVKHISNKSGHYEPSNVRLAWAIEFLKERGFDFKSARIDDVGRDHWFGNFWDRVTGLEP